MPFERPTLSALVLRCRSDFRGRLSIAGPLVRRAMADVLGAVWGGAVHMLHGHLDWVSKQLFADLAERELLLRQASLYDISPAPASYATGSVLASGVDGSTIPAETIVQLEGVRYRVTADATIVGGIATVAVKAVLAGAADVAAGATITFESPVAGVNSEVTAATGGIGAGYDEEDTEGTRDRLLLRLREPPQGGTDHDYESWALAVPGVTDGRESEHGLDDVADRRFCQLTAASSPAPSRSGT